MDRLTTAFCACILWPALAPGQTSADTGRTGPLPVYDHVLIVMEENKYYDEVIGNAAAPYINKVLREEGANLTHIYAEEHNSEGNYFWLFSGATRRSDSVT